MNFATNEKGNVLLVKLPGDHLDANNSKEFKESIVPVIDERKKVLFDLSDIHFVDSSGLGALLSCLRRLNQVNGDLKLFGMTKSVRALFELVRMNKIFGIYNTEEEALRAFDAS